MKYKVLVKMTGTKDAYHTVNCTNPKTAFRVIKHMFSNAQGVLNPTVILGKPIGLPLDHAEDYVEA